MEVLLVVPKGTDISVVQNEYPDIWEDDGASDTHQHFYVGQSDNHSWMTYRQAVEFCGFAEGAIKDADCTIDGNGEWAQATIKQRDFSNLAIPESDKKRRKQISNWYWAAHLQGRKAADKLELRRVQWVNIWDQVRSFSGDAGSRAHLTGDGIHGHTLCGKYYPADKGSYSPNKWCKRCVNKAYALGFEKGFTKGLAHVPSRED